MFVVVAIVIFGIFVGLAYTVFGSEGLTKDLKGLFTASIEQSDYRENKRNLITKESLYGWYLFNIDDKMSILNDNTVELKVSTGSSVSGLGINTLSILDENKNYALSFTITKDSGDIVSLGGHLDFSSETTVILNGKLLDNKEYAKGDAFQHGFNVEKDVNEVVVLFNTNSFEEDYYYNNPVSAYNNPIQIQPNRLYDSTGKEVIGFKKAYSATISNITIKERK